MSEIKKALDQDGLLYFGKEYYRKLQDKFVAIESGKALSTNDYTTAEKEKLGGIEAGAEVNVVEVVKVNGTALTPNSSKEVDVTVAESTTNGSIRVNGVDVAVHGLGSAAYTASSAYDPAGSADAVLGDSNDTSATMTVYGVKAALDAALGNGGNVATQISNAVAALDATQSGSASGTAQHGGTFVASGVQVVEADGVITGVNITSTEVEAAGAAATAEQNAKDYADGLASNYDAAGAAAAVLGTSSDTASANTVYGVKAALADALGNGGSVATQITTAINGLDASDAAVANQFVTSVSEADGLITVTRAQPSAANVSVAALSGIAAGDLQTVLGALETAIGTGGTNAAVTITETAGTGDVLKVYTVAQGGTTVGTINIPKDFLVKSGSVRAATAQDSGYTVGEKLLDFVVNTVGGDGTDTHIIVPVSDLVDVYTAGNGINVSNANVVSAVVDSTSESFLTVGAGGLKLAGVQTAIDTAEGAAETYAAGLIAALDADVDASGTAAHSGTFVVSGITEVNGVITGVDSVEVEVAGAAAAAQSAAQTYASGLVAALDADLDASGTAQHSGTFVMSGVTQVDGVLTAVDSVEVEVAGAAAAAQAAAAADATSKANAAQAAAEAYADSVAAAVGVTASVDSGSTGYVTASASGKAVTIGVTAGTIASLALADSAVQSISKVAGTEVDLTLARSGNAVTITVDDSTLVTDLGAKATKVGNAVNGNLAALDSSGDLVDSGYSVSSLTVQYMNNTEIQDIVNTCFAPAQQQGS